VATHGRSFWILDDISPLRQMSPETRASETKPQGIRLFKPATAIRIRANVNNDTPLPPEEPAGQNPPTGAILYYSLNAIANSELTLEVFDGNGRLIRHLSSHEREALPQLDQVPFTSYWFRPPAPPSSEAGLHRVNWDLRYAAPPVKPRGFSMATAYGQNTPAEPEGRLCCRGHIRSN